MIMYIAQHDLEIIESEYTPGEIIIAGYERWSYKAVRVGSNNTPTVRREAGIHNSYVQLFLGSMIGGLILHKTDG